MYLVLVVDLQVVIIKNIMLCLYKYMPTHFCLHLFDALIIVPLVYWHTLGLLAQVTHTVKHFMFCHVWTG